MVHLERSTCQFQSILPERQDQNLALTSLCVPKNLALLSYVCHDRCHTTAVRRRATSNIHKLRRGTGNCPNIYRVIVKQYWVIYHTDDMGVISHVMRRITATHLATRRKKVGRGQALIFREACCGERGQRSHLQSGFANPPT